MYKNKLLLISIIYIIFILKCNIGYSQYWIHGSGGLVEDEAMGVSNDNNENLYTTGYFGGSAHFSNIVLNSSGISDIFLMKNSSDGQVVWVVKAGGVGEDRGLSIATDDSGNSYITGFFSGQQHLILKL